MSRDDQTDDCDDRQQALRLARRAALTLDDWATQLRVAKSLADGVLELLCRLRELHATPDWPPHLRKELVEVEWMGTKLDDTYCETEALIYQLDCAIAKWESETLEPTQH